jgi:hypothetical protein
MIFSTDDFDFLPSARGLRGVARLKKPPLLKPKALADIGRVSSPGLETYCARVMSALFRIEIVAVSFFPATMTSRPFGKGGRWPRA